MNRIIMAFFLAMVASCGPDKWRIQNPHNCGCEMGETCDCDECDCPGGDSGDSGHDDIPDDGCGGGTCPPP